MELPKLVPIEKKWRARSRKEAADALQLLAKHGGGVLIKLDDDPGRDVARMHDDKQYRCDILFGTEKSKGRTRCKHKKKDTEVSIHPSPMEWPNAIQSCADTAVG